MTTGAPEPPAGGGSRGATLAWLVRALLDYMQRPWQAITIILIIVILGLGWIVWSERANLIDLLRISGRRTGPLVLRQNLLPDINGLLNDTSADLVAVWSVDLGANVQRLVLDSKRGDGDWAPDLRVLPVLSNQSNVGRIVTLLAGQPVCDSTSVNPANLLLRRAAQDGYSWFCAVPIPPQANETQIGVIYIAWKKTPDAANEHTAKTAGMIAAENMVMR